MRIIIIWRVLLAATPSRGQTARGFRVVDAFQKVIKQLQ